MIAVTTPQFQMQSAENEPLLATAVEVPPETKDDADMSLLACHTRLVAAIRVSVNSAVEGVNRGGVRVRDNLTAEKFYDAYIRGMPNGKGKFYRTLKIKSLVRQALLQIRDEFKDVVKITINLDNAPTDRDSWDYTCPSYSIDRVEKPTQETDPACKCVSM